MKKFIIFFLMVFLYLGNSQARNVSTSLVDVGKYPIKSEVGYLLSPDVLTSAAAPAPGVEVFCVGPTLACMNEIVQFTAVINDPNNTGTYTYQWMLNGQYLPGETDQIYRVSTDTLYERHDLLFYHVTVMVTVNGCDPIVSQELPFSITRPVVHIMTDNNVICLGGTVTLTGYLDDYNIPNITYQWYKNADTLFGQTSPSLTTVVSNGSDIYKLKVTQNPAGCFDTASVVVDSIIRVLDGIYSLADAATLVTNRDTICSGGQVGITAYLVNGNNAPYIDSTLNYTWYRNGFLIPEVTGPRFYENLTLSDLDPTIFVYKVVISLPGCDNDTLAILDTIYVKRNPLLVIEGHHDWCENDLVHLRAWVDGLAVLDETQGYFRWYVDGMYYIADPSAPNSYSYSRIWPPAYQPHNAVVEYITPNGCNAISAPFEFWVHPTPILNILASEDSVCIGAEVNLSAQLDNWNESMFTYQWYKNAVNYEPDAIPGATTLNYTAHINNVGPNNFSIYANQLNSRCNANATYVVYGFNTPVIDNITIGDDPNEICEGHQLTFTAHKSGGVAGGEIYTWYKDGIIIPNATLNTYTEAPEAIDNEISYHVYNVTVRQTASACESIYDPSTEVVITVKPNPTVVIEGAPIVCQETTDNVHLIANAHPAPASGDYMYEWFLDNVSLGAPSIDNEYITTGQYRYYPYNYRVNVYNDYGCTASSAVFPVLVNAAPVVTIVPSENPVCETGEVTMTAMINDNNMDMLTYVWYKNNVLIAGATHNVYTTTVNENTTFKVEVNQLTSLCTTPAELEIIVKPRPAIASINISKYEICSGGQLVITANIDQNKPGIEGIPYVFTWYKNGILIPGATAATLYDSPLAVDDDITYYIYSATVSQSVSGCNSDEAYAAQVNVYRNPLVMIQGDHHVCATTMVTLVANVDMTSLPVGNLHYTWYESGQVRNNLAAGYGDSKYYLEYYYPREDPYVFQVEVTRGNGCTTMSEPFYVWVYEEPVVNITVSEPEICVGGEVLFTANLNNYNNPTLVGTSNYITYQWYKVDTIATEILWGGHVVETLYQRVETDIPGATGPNYLAINLDTTSIFGVRVKQIISECTDNDEFKIIVHEKPVIDSIYLTDDADTICEGRQITLNARVNGGIQGNEIFTWFVNGALINGVTGNYYTGSPMTIDNELTLYIYNALVHQTPSGCFTSATNDTNDYVITVFPNPTVEIAADPIVCEATYHNIQLSANVLPVHPVNGSYTFTWYENNAEINFSSALDSISENGDTIYITKPYREYPYSFSVKIANEFGCFVESENILIYVNDTAIIHTTATDTSICAGGEVTLSALMANWNANELELQWYHKGPSDNDYSPVPIGTLYNYTTILNETGAHSFRFSAHQRTSGCIGLSDVTKITVYSRPVVETITADPDTICEGRQIVVTATISGGVPGGEVYTWYKNNEIVTGVIGNILIDNPMTADHETTRYIYRAEVVQTSAGCSSTNFAADTVYVHPNPTVVIATDPIVCETGNSNVILQANVNPAVPAYGTYTYSWYEDNHFVTTTPNNTYNVTKPYREYPYNFHVEIGNNYGCTVTSEVVYVYVNDTAVINISATEDTICEGGNVTLSAHLQNWNANELELQWYHKGPNDNGFTAIGTATSIDWNLVLSETGNHQFKFSAYQRTSGCNGVSNILNVFVRPIPVVAIMITQNPVICLGGRTTINATIINPNPNMGTAVYTWYRNGVVIPGANTSVLSEFLTAVDEDMSLYNYYATVHFTASGCESNPSNTALVTVLPHPTVTVSADHSLTYCDGGEVTLTANVAPASTGYTYQWYVDNVLIPDATGSDYISSLPARETPYQYHVVINSLPGCEIVSSVVFVNVIADPVVNITVDHSSICEGGVATFTAHVEGGISNVNGLGNYTFAWHNNLSTSTILGTAETYTIPNNLAADNYVYFVDVTSPYGCQTTAYYINFTVVPDPVVAIHVAAGYDESICSGGSTLLEAVVTGGLGTASYQWYKNGVILPGETNQVLNTGLLYFGNTANNTFTVHVTQTGVDCSAWSDPYTVTVTQPLEVEVTGYANVCVGGTVTLTAVVTPIVANNNLTYRWYKNNSIIYGATQAQYTTEANLIPGNYEYYVVVTGTISGCSVATSGTVTANVLADPIVSINGGNSACQGEALTIHASIVGGVEGSNYIYTWTWLDQNGVQQSAQTAGPDFTIPTLPANEPANPYHFYVTIHRTDNTGCNATSQPFAINIKQVATINIAVDYSLICVGGTSVVTATVNPQGTYDFNWRVNGTLVPSTQYNTLTLNTSSLQIGANVINLAVIPTGNVTTCANNNSTTITVVPDPVIEAGAITANHSTLCAGASVTVSLNESLVSTHGINAGIANYQWALSGIEIPGAIQSSFLTPILNTPGTYTYTLRVTLDNFEHLGCNSTWSQPVTITVAPQPDVNILRTDANSNLDVCLGGNVEITAFINNNNPIYGTVNYQWQLGGVNIPGATSNPYTPVMNNIGNNFAYRAIASFTGYNCNAVSNTIAVNVVNQPSWTNIDVVGVTDGHACLGTRVLLYASVQGGIEDNVLNTNGIIQWFVNIDGNIRPVTGNIGGFSFDDVTVPGTYTYFVTYTGQIGSGCSLDPFYVTSINADVAPATLVVHELPTASFMDEELVICVTDDHLLIPVSFTGTAPYSMTITNTNTGQTYHFTNILSNPYVMVLVPPTETTTFTIVQASDKYCDSELKNANLTIRVNVTNVKLPALVVADCATPYDGYYEVQIPVTILDPNYRPLTYDCSIAGYEYSPFSITGAAIAGYENDRPYITARVPITAQDYIARIIIDGGCVHYVTIRVRISNADAMLSTLIEQRWDDVLVVNNNPGTNGGYFFTNFQWYNNGVAIPAPAGTKQYLHVENGFNGEYWVVLNGTYTYKDSLGVTHTDSVSYTTCPITPKRPSTLKVFPVPARVGQQIVIETGLSDTELQGAILDIYDARGAHVQSIKNVEAVMHIDGFSTQGAYFGRITTGTSEIKTVKFVIVK